MPLIEELWIYFYTTYLNPDEYYENLGAQTPDTLRLIILGLAVGMSLAAFAAAYNKQVLGAVVRRIIDAGAMSPDNALTLDELGFGKKPLMHLAVAKSLPLRRVVECREEREWMDAGGDGKFRLDTHTAHFYIPEDKKWRAEVRFEKRGTTFPLAALITVLLAVAYLVAIVCLPELLSLLDSFIGSFKA